MKNNHYVYLIAFKFCNAFFSVNACSVLIYCKICDRLSGYQNIDLISFTLQTWKQFHTTMKTLPSFTFKGHLMYPFCLVFYIHTWFYMKQMNFWCSQFNFMLICVSTYKCNKHMVCFYQSASVEPTLLCFLTTSYFIFFIILFCK